MMSENELIDKTLNLAHKAQTFSFFELYEQATGKDTGDVQDLAEAKNIATLMMGYDLIEKRSSPMYKTTAFGIKISNSGGWLKHKKEEENDYMLSRLRQVKEDEKLGYDLKISKYLSKTRWWPLFISLVSLIIAVWSLFKTD